jgi:hypothetical protein
MNTQHAHSNGNRAARHFGGSAAADTDAKTIEQLESLPSGARIVTGDKKLLVRTTSVCICFCDITTGKLCSAKDVVFHFGGIGGGLG